MRQSNCVCFLTPVLLCSKHCTGVPIRLLCSTKLKNTLVDHLGDVEYWENVKFTTEMIEKYISKCLSVCMQTMVCNVFIFYTRSVQTLATLPKVAQVLQRLPRIMKKKKILSRQKRTRNLQLQRRPSHLKPAHTLPLHVPGRSFLPLIADILTTLSMPVKHQELVSVFITQCIVKINLF